MRSRRPPVRLRSSSSPVRARLGQWIREAGLPRATAAARRSPAPSAGPPALRPACPACPSSVPAHRRFPRRGPAPARPAAIPDRLTGRPLDPALVQVKGIADGEDRRVDLLRPPASEAELRDDFGSHPGPDRNWFPERRMVELSTGGGALPQSTLRRSGYGLPSSIVGGPRSGTIRPPLAAASTQASAPSASRPSAIAGT